MLRGAVPTTPVPQQGLLQLADSELGGPCKAFPILMPPKTQHLGEEG